MLNANDFNKLQIIYGMCYWKYLYNKWVDTKKQKVWIFNMLNDNNV